MIALLAPGQGSQTEGMLSPWLQLPRIPRQAGNTVIDRMADSITDAIVA
ncbi:hypothetical protein GR254_16885 [Mycobacterium tuberculosis]|nr:hypothetical protein [Mycobacterium tuberculosis]